jgi:hypothetical protein
MLSISVRIWQHWLPATAYRSTCPATSHIVLTHLLCACQTHLLLCLRGLVHALQGEGALLLVTAVVIQLLSIEQVLHERLSQSLCILLCIQRRHSPAERLLLRPLCLLYCQLN